MDTRLDNEDGSGIGIIDALTAPVCGVQLVSLSQHHPCGVLAWPGRCGWLAGGMSGARGGESGWVVS